MKNNILVLMLISVMVLLTSCGEEKVGENLDNASTQEQIVNEMKNDIQDISKKVQNGEITDEEAETAMMDSMNNSETFQTQLEKSKEQMPKFLKILKANKKCIGKADDKSDAEDCEKEAIKLAEKLGVLEMYGDEEEYDDFEWNDDIKKEALVEIDMGIKEFETMLPCIEKAETMTDMMQCGGE